MRVALLGHEPSTRTALESACAAGGHDVIGDGAGPVDLAVVEPGPTADATVVARLAARRPRPRIAVVTAYPSLAGAVALARAGADIYLSVAMPAAVFALLTADAGPDEPAPAMPSLALAEWEYISFVLTTCRGNISRAARLLGIHRQSLQRKLRKRPPPR